MKNKEVEQDIRDKAQHILDFIQTAGSLSDEELQQKLAQDPELSTILDIIHLGNRETKK